jgi:hypothetical protein
MFGAKRHVSADESFKDLPFADTIPKSLNQLLLK